MNDSGASSRPDRARTDSRTPGDAQQFQNNRGAGGEASAQGANGGADAQPKPGLRGTETGTAAPPPPPLRANRGATEHAEPALDVRGQLEAALQREASLAAQCEAQNVEHRRLLDEVRAHADEKLRAALLQEKLRADETVRTAVHDVRRWHAPEVETLRGDAARLRDAVLASEQREVALQQAVAAAEAGTEAAEARAAAAEAAQRTAEVCSLRDSAFWASSCVASVAMGLPKCSNCAPWQVRSVLTLFAMASCSGMYLCTCAECVDPVAHPS